MILVGCGKKNKSIHDWEPAPDQEKMNQIVSNTDLNDRQRKILEIEGLSQDYWELNGKAQDSIIKVELCYTFIEDKYPEDEFEYVEYSYGTLNLKSKLLGSNHNVRVTLNWTGDKFYFWDNYQLLLDSELYAKEIEKFVKEKYPNAELFVDALVDEGSWKSGDAYIMKRAAGESLIVMEDVFSDEDEAKVLLNDVASWMDEQNPTLSKLITIFVLSKDEFQNVDVDNWKDYHRNHNSLYEFSCQTHGAKDRRIY